MWCVVWCGVVLWFPDGDADVDEEGSCTARVQYVCDACAVWTMRMPNHTHSRQRASQVSIPQPEPS